VKGEISIEYSANEFTVVYVLDTGKIFFKDNSESAAEYKPFNSVFRRERTVTVVVVEPELLQLLRIALNIELVNP
jgi:hypothetical protein